MAASQRNGPRLTPSWDESPIIRNSYSFFSSPPQPAGRLIQTSLTRGAPHTSHGYPRRREGALCARIGRKHTANWAHWSPMPSETTPLQRQKTPSKPAGNHRNQSPRRNTLRGCYHAPGWRTTVGMAKDVVDATTPSRADARQPPTSHATLATLPLLAATKNPLGSSSSGGPGAYVISTERSEWRNLALPGYHASQKISPLRPNGLRSK